MESYIRYACVPETNNNNHNLRSSATRVSQRSHNINNVVPCSVCVCQCCLRALLFSRRNCVMALSPKRISYMTPFNSVRQLQSQEPKPIGYGQVQI